MTPIIGVIGEAKVMMFLTPEMESSIPVLIQIIDANWRGQERMITDCVRLSSVVDTDEESPTHPIESYTTMRNRAQY